MLQLADEIITHLRTFNKKVLHEIWSGCLMTILRLYSHDQTFIEQALDLSDPMNNHSCHKIAANILQSLTHLVLDT